MAVNLQTPILSTRTRSINFFNGRLLAGEDLTTEQKTNRIAHTLLGQAVGDGVVYGFEVKESALSSTTQAPVLVVTQGLAVNKNGAALLLDTDTEVGLVKPATTTNDTSTSTSIFQDCTPTQSGTYIAGAGVFLLTVGPANAPQGLAPVSGIGTTQAPCNSKYNVQGVQFRLIPITTLTQDQLNDTNHLRNLVAYQCFGVADQSTFISDPFGTQLTSYGLLDQLLSNQTLTNCDVPLALLYWTSDSGIVFVDMWAVRRPVFPQTTTEMWAPFASRRRMAEGIAMFLQFQDQLNALMQSAAGATTLTSITASNYFYYLPSAGFLPIGNINPSAGFDYLQFFSNRTYRNPVFIEGARLDQILHTAFLYPPIDLSNQEMLWVYQVRENQEAIDNNSTSAPPLYMLFTSGRIGFQGDAQYDLNYFNYANYV
jgi:hypothetical protein